MGKRKHHSHSESPVKSSEPNYEHDFEGSPKKGANCWPDSDLLQLVNKIAEHIPESDNLAYTRRLDSINWEEIPFKAHSVKECQQTWSVLLKQVRKFRLLKEIVDDMKEWVLKPNNQHKNHIFKHPEKPRQPKNSYMLFDQENRQRVTQSSPDLTSNEVSKKLGQMYKDLSIEEKQKYIKLAQIERGKYSENMQNFYENHPEFIPSQKPTKRRKIVELEEGRGPPPKPKTPFELFVQVESEKARNYGSRLTFIQNCRVSWKEMPDKDKLFWINWSEEQYTKYMEDLKDYMKTHPEFEPEQLKNILTKKEKAVKERCSGKPQKPPRGAYQLFVTMMGQSDEIRQVSGKDVLFYMAERWKACSDEEKNEYKVRLDQMWQEYHIKMDEYLRTLHPEERDKILEKDTGRNFHKFTNTFPSKGTKIKPQAPPKSVYKYFLSVYKDKGNPSKVWRNMGKEEKQVYADQLEKEKRKYIDLYQEYLRNLTAEELDKMEAPINANSSADSESEEDDI